MIDPPTPLDTRLAGPADAAALGAWLGDEFAEAVARGDTVMICEIPGEAIRAGAVLRWSATPTIEDGGPVGAMGPVGTGRGLDGHAAGEGVGRVLLGAERFFRAEAVEKWILTLEATAHISIRAAEALGYRPTGRGPYREIGPGVVEYLHGYTGPEGFVVDFERAG